MSISPDDRSPRTSRRRSRLLREEERRAERRSKIVPLFPIGSAHPAGGANERLRDRVAAFMAELDFTDSTWF